MATAPGLLDPELAEKLRKLTPDYAAYVLHRIDWLSRARAEQVPPSPEEQAQWLTRMNLGYAQDNLKARTPDPAEPWTEFGAQAGRGFGKAVHVLCPVPTPTGWATMGELRVGDEVIGSDGRPVRVTFVSHVMRDRPCYLIRWDDDSRIVADADHQWLAMPGSQPPRVVTTEEFLNGAVWRTPGRPAADLPAHKHDADPAWRRVVGVWSVPSVPVCCISVDAPDALFCIGKTWVVTHNTRMGAEWMLQAAWEDPQALPRCVVAPTQQDVRMTCFEGESGLLNIIPPECVANYNRTELVLTLTNGAMLRGFSAEKADRLRGPQHADAWLDELAGWGPDGEDVFDMLMFGMRLGDRPRIVWTSTPKPNALIRRLTAPKAGRIIVRGSTFDNRANLPDSFFKQLEAYDGTKLGRQELYGELLDPEEAGIIRRSWLRLWPADKPLPSFQWIIMSLDTAFTERTLDKKGDADPTACGVFGVFLHEKRTNVMLLDCWEDHLGLPELTRRVRKEMNNRYGDDEDDAVIKPLVGSPKPIGSGRKPDILLIEDKGSGISLRQTLAEQGIEAYAYNPGRADKLSRLHIVSPIFAQRRVWMPESNKMPGKPRNWCEPLIAQLCSFTGEGSVKHDDYVDVCTQALRLMTDKGMLSLVKPPEERRDYTPPPPPDYSNPYDV